MTDRTKELIDSCLFWERIVTNMFEPIIELAKNPYCQRPSIEMIMPVFDEYFELIIGFLKAQWGQNLSTDEMEEVAVHLASLEEYFQAQKASALAMIGGEANEANEATKN